MFKTVITCQAITFLHECGVMLHYNNYTQGLNKLYFIQPEWLSDIFGKIITIPEVQNWWVYV